MRISEILDWNDEPAEPNDYEPQLDQLPARFSDDLTKLAAPSHGVAWSSTSGICTDQKVSPQDQRRQMLNLS